MSTDPRGVMILNGQKILIQTFGPAPGTPTVFSYQWWYATCSYFLTNYRENVLPGPQCPYQTLYWISCRFLKVKIMIYLLEIHSIRYLHADSSKFGIKSKVKVFILRNHTFFQSMPNSLFFYACNGLFCSIIRSLFHPIYNRSYFRK